MWRIEILDWFSAQQEANKSHHYLYSLKQKESKRDENVCCRVYVVMFIPFQMKTQNIEAQHNASNSSSDWFVCYRIQFPSDNRVQFNMLESLEAVQMYRCSYTSQTEESVDGRGGG